MSMSNRSLDIFNSSTKQKLLKILKVSYLSHMLRVHIKSNLIAISYKFSFVKNRYKRNKEFSSTKSGYRKLKRKIDLQIKYRKMLDAWNVKDYLLFTKLSLRILFAWPIRFFKAFFRTFTLLKNFFNNIFNSKIKNKW
jgi:hypothetical protein